MHNYTIDTTLPFPFLEFNEIVTATEVKKPTGVTYMLLVLLKESKNTRARIVDLLEVFGIPSKMHQIFADELRKLIEQRIIKFVGSPRTFNQFSKYTLNDFAFTVQGNKIFAEEQISTGKEKESKVKCYYDIALNELSLKPNPDLEIKPLYETAFDEKFVNQFEVKKDVEDFFNSKKGPQFQVKAAEIITNVELQEQKCLVGKYLCKLIIKDDDLDIRFEHKYVQEFFDKYYKVEFINKAIELKNKFKFEKSYNGLLTNFKDNEVYKVMVPSDLCGILNKKYQLVVARNDVKINKNNMIINHDESIDVISQYADFITVESGQVFAYCSMKLKFSSTKGDVYLPLLIALKPSLEELSKAINKYIDTKKSYSYENFKEIASICNITKDYDKLVSMLNSYLNNSSDTNISILNEVKPLFTTTNKLLEEYKTILKKHYIQCIKDVREDSIESLLQITSKIPSFLGIKNVDALDLIIKYLGKVKNSVATFEVLAKYFDDNLVLSYINPFNDVLNGNKPFSNKLSTILVFDNALKELTNMTGIKDYVKYSTDEDEIEKPLFKSIFITANDAYKSISVFKDYNKDYFASADKFMAIFSRMNDNFNILDAALKNPKNIKKDLIDKKITKGDYQFVLINLSAKLELMLGEKYNLVGTLADKLSQAKRGKLIDKDIIEDFFQMKENRNALAHPEERTSNYKADDLRRWSDEVFALEGEK